MIQYPQMKERVGAAMNAKLDVSVEEFKQALSVYTAEDYYESLAPEQYLVDLLYYDYDKYKAYEPYLLADGLSKGVPLMVVRDVFASLSDQINTTQMICSLVKQIANDVEYQDRVSVLPIMCGKGKSSSISYFIKEHIESEERNGVIVVTDSVRKGDAP